MRPTLSLALTLLPLTSLAFAQGRRSDFERSASLDERTRDLVTRDNVHPHWIPATSVLWYRVDTGKGTHEFVLVDSEHGSRRVFAEQKDLIAALRAAGADPTSDSTIGAMHPSTVRRSRRGGEPVTIEFVNSRTDRVVLYWLDERGNRVEYAHLPPAGRFGQHTFCRHAWVATTETGDPIAAFAIPDSTSDGAVATIPNTTPEAPPDAGPKATPRSVAPDHRLEAAIEGHQVVLVDTASKARRTITQDGTESDSFTGDFEWAPDSAHLIAWRLHPGEHRQVTIVESSPRDQTQPKVESFRYDKPGDRLDQRTPYLITVATSEARPLYSPKEVEGAFDIDFVRWTADGSRAVFRYNQRGHQLLALDAFGGDAQRTRLAEERSDTFVDYSQKTWFQFIDSSHELIWMSERSGWNHLYLVDANDGRVKNAITAGEFVVHRVLEFDESRREIWLLARGITPGEDPYHDHLCRVNFDGSGFTKLTEGDGTHTIEFSPDHRFFVDRWSRVDLPPVSELRDARSGKLVTPLEKADASRLLAAGWTLPERFTAKGRDGATDICGFLIKPSNFDPKKKYPVVDDIYSGPHDAHVPKTFDRLLYPHQLAELGFIVVQIDGMGTNWRSKAFHDVCWRNLKDAGIPDHIAWLKAKAAIDPSLDLTNVGIFGVSAGGQNALAALLHHGDFYRVGIADCGCHDNRMDKVWWNEAWMGYPIGPWYAENSNVVNAPKLTGDLFLIVGEMDHNVDPASTMQVVDALIRANKDFDLLVVPGADHGAGESPYGRRRQADFLVRHLWHVEPRATD